MEIKNYFAQDAQGNIMPSANCYLYFPGTTNLATGLVDGNGVPISNPFLASGMGQITFGAPNGVYDLRVTLGSRDWTIKVQCADIAQAMDVMDSILGSHAENPTTRNNGQPLEPGDETWNSTDKQPYWWNGADWVALNSSAQQLEERLTEPDGSAKVGFTQAGSGSTSRTSLDKMREVVSVKDCGAVGDAGITGVAPTDDTEAFLSAPFGAYVPAGNYYVDTLRVLVNAYTGPGKLYAHNGQIITLDNDPVGQAYVARKVMAPVFGGAEGIPPLYPTATNAPQGLARVRNHVTGEEFYYINQLGTGVSWSASERSVVLKFPVRDDGAPATVIEHTGLIKQTHAHLSAILEAGETWIYQSFVPPDDSINNTSETGCGWSKYVWKGAANIDSDLINYRVWGRPGSGHKYQDYGKACVQMSQDGRYMLMIGINYTGNAGGRTLFVYDRLEVESAANPLLCEPVYMSQPLEGTSVDGDTAYQGEASDGRYLYNVWGSASVFGRRGIVVSTLNGNKLREINLDGSAGEYTTDELRNGHPTLGIMVSSEPEGLALWGNKMYVMFSDRWAALGAVVSFNGNNYVSTVVVNLNRIPDQDTIRWRITDLPATAGEWNSTTTYACGATTRNNKTIYEVGPPEGRPDEVPLVRTYRYPASIAQYPGDASQLVNASFDHGGYWRLSSHVPSTDSYRIALEFLQNRIRIRDVRNGADNNKYGSLARTSNEVNDFFQIYASGNSATEGAYIYMYGNADPTVPGELRISSSGVGGVRTMADGLTRMNCTAADIAMYVTPRPIDDGTLDNGTVTRRWATVRTNRVALGVSTCTDESGMGSPEGVVTASPGSTYRNRNGGELISFYVKESGRGNTGWVGK